MHSGREEDTPQGYHHSLKVIAYPLPMEEHHTEKKGRK